MLGIIPAAGSGSRIQPLAFSKELLPVGSRLDRGCERPRAVSEYLIDRMIAGGTTRICIIISPAKLDIVRYYGAGIGGVPFCYLVQPSPAGLCDALFRAVPVVADDEEVVVGLPDTIWFPADGFRTLPKGDFSFLLFPVGRPEFFDAVVTDATGTVTAIQVKDSAAATPWVWGAFRLPGAVFRDLGALWRQRNRCDEYFGSLVNAHVARGGGVLGVKAGESYVDVGTLNGYREAIELLGRKEASGFGPHQASGFGLQASAQSLERSDAPTLQRSSAPTLERSNAPTGTSPCSKP